MDDYDQSRVVDFLGRAESHGDGDRPVEIIETHISVVFLVADRAFKMKRAVSYPYLDFSTLELRRRNCLAEVAVNGRTAPQLYVGVVAVNRDRDGGLNIGGEGEAIEWLVEMKRFDQSTLFDRLAVAGKLDRHLAGDLARVIADFHLAARPCPELDNYKGTEETIFGLAAGFSMFGGGVFDKPDYKALCMDQLAILSGVCGEVLRLRQRAGLVRHCHGDLHLRNICLIDGRPTLFDAIEFNDSFSHIDVLYDLAFVLMDLDHRRLRGLANMVLNSYLDITGDTGGLQCLSLFLSMRAAVRSQVGATAAARHSSRSEARRLVREARSYLSLARQYLVHGTPRLIAVGGFSGSGKSRLGRDLAPFVGLAPGALVARSDILRKRLAGVDPLDRLPPEGYSRAMTRRTYDALYEQARITLECGHSVIADAVFADPRERRAISDIALEMDVPFDGLWLQAPPRVMRERVSARRRNASDADEAVVDRQLASDPGEIEWKLIDSSGGKPATLEKGLDALGLSVVSGGPEGA